MSERNTDFQFVDSDTAALESELISMYETMTGVTVQPSSPERLYIAWVLSVIQQLYATINYVGNQNIPSRAEGENLDALAQLFYNKERPKATAAFCTMRFICSAPQTSAILIPKGTRVTDSSEAVYWETREDVYIAIGDTFADVIVDCQTAGESGNGYAPGQICQCVDLFDYYESCENITESGGGSEEASDEEFYNLMRSGQDGYTTAGSVGAYQYLAQKASTGIADVKAICEKAGCVDLYALMDTGKIADEGTKAAILESCSSDKARPLTDLVTVKDPEIVQYDIDITYYIPQDTELSAGEIQYGVTEGVEAFQQWQSERLGRDINPSFLIQMLMNSGIKRVEVAKPIFTHLSDGSGNTAPQVAACGTVSIKNGGYEHG